MKKRELEREGKKWVEDGIISQEQLDEILKRQEEKSPRSIILLFSVLLIGLGFLTFMMSEWARVPHISRVIVILVVTVFLYVLGNILYRKGEELLGVCFIVLGFIVFGSGMLLTIDVYGETIYSAWPFIIWAIVGLVLIYIYKHPLLFGVTLIVATAGQLYSAANFYQFNWILFALFILGLGFVCYKERNKLYSYFFTISYLIQILVLTTTEFNDYYWFLVLILPLYIAGDLLKGVYKSPLKNISIASIFVYGMHQAFILQEDWYLLELDFELSFIIVWFLLFAAGTALKFKGDQKEELIDYVLFLPVVFLPFSYILSLILLFIFSLGWIISGYLKNNHSYILLGTVAFLFSTFTVYIQFAWNELNRSLFFLIGGVILFCISFLIDKQLRKLRDKENRE